MMDRDMIMLAAEVGAKAALVAARVERENESAERSKRKHTATRWLLQHYRELRQHAESAVFSADKATDELKEIEMLMTSWEVGTVRVDGIKQTATQTVIIVAHITEMLSCYKTRCEKSGNPTELRRWRVIQALYLDDEDVNGEVPTVKSVAEAEGIDERMVYKDIDAAIERLTIYIFGVGGF